MPFMVFTFFIAFIIVVLFLVFMVGSAMGPNPEDDKFNQTLKEHGLHFRLPKTKWQRFLLMTSRESLITRRTLGGKWESYIHDIGTFHACITWHWVEKFHPEYKGLPLFRTEDYDRFNDTKR